MSRWERWSTKPKEGLSYKVITEQQTPAEMARGMGLQSDGSGGYVDPSTGQVVARTVNNELVFYDPMGGAISAQSDGAALTQAQPSWKDPVTGELVVPPSKAESPEEVAAVPDPIPAQAPASYNAFMNMNKKKMYADQTTPEQEDINTIQQEIDPSLGMQSPLQAEGMTFAQLRENELEDRMAKAYDRRVDQAVDTAPKKFVARNVANNTIAASPQAQKVAQKVTTPTPTPKPTPKLSDTDGDGDIDINDLRNTARESWKNWTTKKKTAEHRVEQNLNPLIEALNKPGVDPKKRNRIMHTLMNSYRYQGRDNEASSDLNKAEFHALRDRKKRIQEAYGGEGSDGSTHNLDAIRAFQKEINNTEMDDELIDASFNALSPAQQKIYGGGDMTPRQGYGKFLRQGGLGGYTGLPLDNRTMQMEHFIDHTQARELAALAKKEKRDMTPEEQELHDFIIGEDNQFWSRQAPNEQKSSRNIAQFFGDRVDPLEALGDDFFDYRELTVDPARLDLKNEEKGMISALLDRDGDGQVTLSEMSLDQFDSHRNAVDAVYEGKKKDLLGGLSEAFDEQGLMKLGPKAFDKRVADENSPISEDDRSRYDMLRTLQSKVKGYNPNFAYRLMQGLGLPTGMIQSERSRSTPASPAIYQAIASQLPGKSKAEQQEFLGKVKELITGANSSANSLRGQGLGDSGIRQEMYQKLLQGGMDQGIFSPEVVQSNPELQGLLAKFLNQNESLQDLLNVDPDDGFELEDILEIVKELGMMDKAQSKKKGKGKMKFESFRRYND